MRARGIVTTALPVLLAGGLVTGCGGADGPSTSSGAPKSASAGPSASPSGDTPDLARLHRVALPGTAEAAVSDRFSSDGLSEDAKVIASAEAGPLLVAVYTDGPKCGAVTLRSHTKHTGVSSATEVERTAGSGAEEAYPGGPYTQASANGPHGSWLKVSCSAQAVVVTYAAPDASLAHAKGEARVVRGSDGPDDALVVARRDLRERIAHDLHAA